MRRQEIRRQDRGIDFETHRERRGWTHRGLDDLVHLQHIGPQLLVAERVETEDELTRVGRLGFGGGLPELAHFLYASTYRGAAKLLEERGVLLPRKPHKNGVDWIFWAEESDAGTTK